MDRQLNGSNNCKIDISSSRIVSITKCQNVSWGDDLHRRIFCQKCLFFLTLRQGHTTLTVWLMCCDQEFWMAQRWFPIHIPSNLMFKAGSPSHYTFASSLWGWESSSFSWCISTENIAAEARTLLRLFLINLKRGVCSWTGCLKWRSYQNNTAILALLFNYKTFGSVPLSSLMSLFT